MQEKLTAILAHMAFSHQQLARILAAKRQVTVRMAHNVNHIPDRMPGFEGVEGLAGNATQLNKSIAAYLTTLAELEEAVGDTLSFVLKAAEPSAEAEE